MEEEKTDKTHLLIPIKKDLFDYALKEAQEKRKSSNYSHEIFEMPDGQKYEVCWFISKII